MNTLTVCMIVRDEAERLGACLESLPPHDQLVVVDTGSIDSTVAIAKNYGAQVEHFTWCDDFAAARNYAESFATGDYIFWIDGDETLDAGHARVREIVEEGVLDAVRPICVGSGQASARHLRQEMLRRRGFGSWKGVVHEYIDVPTLGQVENEIVYRHYDRTVERAWDEEFRFDEMRAMVKDEQFNFRSLAALTRAYAMAGAHVETVALTDAALMRPSDDAIGRSDMLLVQGIAYMHLGMGESAVRAFKQAAVEYDAWPEPFYYTGLGYSFMQDWGHALPWLWMSTTIPQIPEHAPFGDISWRRYATLAQCHINIGRLEEGRKLMERAIAMGGDEAQAELGEQLEAVREKVPA